MKRSPYFALLKAAATSMQLVRSTAARVVIVEAEKLASVRERTEISKRLYDAAEELVRALNDGAPIEIPTRERATLQELWTNLRMHRDAVRHMRLTTKKALRATVVWSVPDILPADREHIVALLYVKFSAAEEFDPWQGRSLPPQVSERGIVQYALMIIQQAKLLPPVTTQITID